MKLFDNEAGNYRFLTGIAPYSAGVVAMPDYEIRHVTLQRPTPYRAGFGAIEAFLNQEERPRAALCAIELRIPAPLSFAGFAAFNSEYVSILAHWNLLRDGVNPIARTNVAPTVPGIVEPCLYGFAYTAPAPSADPRSTFVVAGAGELTDQADLSESAIVRPGETDTDAMREKAAVVMTVMATRLDGLGVDWADVTSINVYTTQPVASYLLDAVLTPAGEAALHGIRWNYSKPPISGLEFEMDLRGVRHATNWK